MNFIKRLTRGLILRFQNIFIICKAGKQLKSNEFSQSDEYKHYLTDQLKHTVGLRTKDAAFRYEKFIHAFLNLPDGKDRSNKILCVGCRNICEIDAFKKEGFQSVVGVDLFSTDPQIMVMDMHNLQFKNNEYDVLYSAATFEKSYDPKKVASEFIRVVKDGGLIILQVGAHYPTNAVDRHDFDSLRNLHSYFTPAIKEILFEEEEANGLATIFRLRK